MSDAAPRFATFADLMALGEAAHCEVLAGELVEKAAPGIEHGVAQGALGAYIGGPFHYDHDGRGPGGWWIATEVDIELAAHDVVRPDVAGWRRERLPQPWGMRPIKVVPDWICEILSPSDENRDRVRKAALYASVGVADYWMLSPTERLLEAYRLEQGEWVRLGAWDDTARVRIAPFEAVELELVRLFPPASGA